MRAQNKAPKIQVFHLKKTAHSFHLQGITTGIYFVVLFTTRFELKRNSIREHTDVIKPTYPFFGLKSKKEKEN